MSEAPDDLIRPFQIESAGLRGRLVRLGPTADEILKRHDYPASVSELLGQALALTAALAGSLKFDGVFTLQTKSDGPVRMMVVDFASPGGLRGYAQFDAEGLAALERREGPAGASVPRLLGGGHVAFSVDQGEDTERYQGIVALEGASLADCAHRYFRESEQIQTAIRLAAGPMADADGAAQWRAAAIMIQRLPEGDPALMARGAEPVADDLAEDDWRRAVALLASVRDDELLSSALAADDLLYRLFHDEGVRVFAPLPLSFGCRCSEASARRMLSSLPTEELADLAIDGFLEVVCEFCNSKYDLPSEDFLHQQG